MIIPKDTILLLNSINFVMKILVVIVALGVIWSQIRRFVKRRALQPEEAAVIYNLWDPAFLIVVLIFSFFRAIQSLLTKGIEHSYVWNELFVSAFCSVGVLIYFYRLLRAYRRLADELETTKVIAQEISDYVRTHPNKTLPISELEKKTR